MALSDTLKLAIRNIRLNFKMALSIVLGSFIILQIIMNMTAYGLSLNNYIKNTINRNSSLRYARVFSDEIPDGFWDKYQDAIEGLQSILSFDINKLCEDNNDSISAKPLEDGEVSFDAAIMELDNHTYIGKNDYSYDFNVDKSIFTTGKEKMVKYEIGVMNYENNLQFSKNELEEYRNKFGNKDVFICGGEFTGVNQIIITDYMLKRFGYEGALSDCVGKKISLFVDTDNGNICLADNYTISGVVDSDFYRINSRHYIPQIVISNADEKYCKNDGMKVFANSFSDVVNISNDEELTLMPSIESFGYSQVETLYIFFKKIVVVIGSVLIVSMCVFVYAVIYFYYKKRIRYISMQRAMGMKKQEVYRLIGTELLLMNTVSFICSIPVFNLIMEFTNELIAKAVYSGYSITKSDMICSMAVSMLIFVGITLFITYLQGRKIKLLIFK